MVDYIVKNEATTVANETNAWQLDHITYSNGIQSIFTTWRFVVKDAMLYELCFYTQPLKVPETLPVAEKIMKSFRFI